jgi:hypothetical protein
MIPSGDNSAQLPRATDSSVPRSEKADPGNGCVVTATFLAWLVLGAVLGLAIGHVIYVNSSHSGGGGGYGAGLQGLEIVFYWFFGLVGGVVGGAVLGAIVVSRTKK